MCSNNKTCSRTRNEAAFMTWIYFMLSFGLFMSAVRSVRADQFITEKDIIVNDVLYNGERQAPELQIKDSGVKLIEGKDYNARYYNIKNSKKEVEPIVPGKYSMDITFIGNYSGSVRTEFSINVKEEIWGNMKEFGFYTFFVKDDPMNTTSAVVSADNADSDGNIFLRTTGGGSAFWVGLHNSPQVITGGPFFYCSFYSDSDSKEYTNYYNMIDDELKKQIENNRFSIVKVGLADFNGKELAAPQEKITCYFEPDNDWDLQDVQAAYLSDESDESIDVSIEMKEINGGLIRVIALELDHFDTLLLYDASKTSSLDQSDALTPPASDQNGSLKPPSSDQKKQISGTPFTKMTSNGKKSLAVTWKMTKGADGYDIFMAKISTKSKKAKFKKQKTIEGGKVLSWKKSGLKAATPYKAYVKAWVMEDGRKKYVNSGPVVYAFTSGGNKKYTNPESIRVNKTKLTLKEGGSYQIKARVEKSDQKKKLLPANIISKVRYESTDRRIASVTKRGKIKAVKQGTCAVYVYAANGVSRKIKITVK